VGIMAMMGSQMWPGQMGSGKMPPGQMQMPGAGSK